MRTIDDAFSQPIYNDRYDHLSPYENFLFALKSKETKRQYPKLLKMFFDFINIEPSKSMEERAHILFAKSKEDRRWLEILERVKIIKRKENNNYDDDSIRVKITYSLDKDKLIDILKKLIKAFSSGSIPNSSQSPNHLLKVYEILKKSIEFMDNISKSGGKMDICFPAESAQYVAIEPIYTKWYKEMKENGVTIRVITEIKDNFEFLMRMIKDEMVDEMRILKKVSCGIAVSENQFMATSYNKELIDDPDALIFGEGAVYHTEKEIIELNQRIFDTLWENAIPIFKK
jgi:hypothetical protein